MDLSCNLIIDIDDYPLRPAELRLLSWVESAASHLKLVTAYLFGEKILILGYGELYFKFFTKDFRYVVNSNGFFDLIDRIRVFQLADMAFLFT